ncbi:MAG: hypothetical protein PHY80_01525 [Rickettsiales bacterium]|nr:hypothetical protein [Rickettsiales bacterium]
MYTREKLPISIESYIRIGTTSEELEKLWKELKQYTLSYKIVSDIFIANQNTSSKILKDIFQIRKLSSAFSCLEFDTDTINNIFKHPNLSSEIFQDLCGLIPNKDIYSDRIVDLLVKCPNIRKNLIDGILDGKGLFVDLKRVMIQTNLDVIFFKELIRIDKELLEEPQRITSDQIFLRIVQRITSRCASSYETQEFIAPSQSVPTSSVATTLEVNQEERISLLQKQESHGILKQIGKFVRQITSHLEKNTQNNIL